MKMEKKKLLLTFSQKLKRSFENGIYVRCLYVALTSEIGPRLQDYDSLIIRLVLSHTDSTYWGPGATNKP